MDPAVEYPHFTGVPGRRQQLEFHGTCYVDHMVPVQQWNRNIVVPPKIRGADYLGHLGQALESIEDFYRCCRERAKEGARPPKEFLVIAFGADTFQGDPDASIRGGMGLELEDYRSMGRAIRGKFPTMGILVTQEGGYNLWCGAS